MRISLKIGVVRMSEKRFKHTDVFNEDVLICRGIEDTENNYVYNFIDDSVYELSEEKLIDLLNDFDEKNKALELIAENKLFTRRELEKENKQLQKKIIEQQATIQQLQREIEEWKKENRELLDQIQEFERIPKGIRELWVE